MIPGEMKEILIQETNMNLTLNIFILITGEEHQTGQKIVTQIEVGETTLQMNGLKILLVVVVIEANMNRES